MYIGNEILRKNKYNLKQKTGEQYSFNATENRQRKKELNKQL